MGYYVAKEHEYLVGWRIPFTAYFLWKDPETRKYRLVVKELNDNYSDNNSIYRFRII